MATEERSPGTRRLCHSARTRGFSRCRRSVGANGLELQRLVTAPGSGAGGSQRPLPAFESASLAHGGTTPSPAAVTGS